MSHHTNTNTYTIFDSVIYWSGSLIIQCPIGDEQCQDTPYIVTIHSVVVCALNSKNKALALFYALRNIHAT